MPRAALTMHLGILGKLSSFHEMIRLSPNTPIPLLGSTSISKFQFYLRDNSLESEHTFNAMGGKKKNKSEKSETLKVISFCLGVCLRCLQLRTQPKVFKTRCMNSALREGCFAMHQQLKINLDRCRREGEKESLLFQAWRCNIRLQLWYITVSEYIHEIQNMDSEVPCVCWTCSYCSCPVDISSAPLVWGV